MHLPDQLLVMMGKCMCGLRVYIGDQFGTRREFMNNRWHMYTVYINTCSYIYIHPGHEFSLTDLFVRQGEVPRKAPAVMVRRTAFFRTVLSITTTAKFSVASSGCLSCWLVALGDNEMVGRYLFFSQYFFPNSIELLLSVK